MRHWAQIFARAAHGGAQKHWPLRKENDIVIDIRMDFFVMSSIRNYDIELENYRQLLSKFGQSQGRNGSKIAKKGSWGASGAPGGPNVGEESLVLFCC